MAMWGKKDKDKEPAPVPAAPPPATAPRAAAPAPAPRAPTQSGLQAPPVPNQIQEMTPALKKALEDSQRVMTTLGEITFVLMCVPTMRGTPIAQLESLVLPAVATNQFAVGKAQVQPGVIAPAAAGIWASVSPEVDRRLSSNLDQQIDLKNNEWQSGDILWLILLAGDPRVTTPMMRKVQVEKLGGRAFKTRLKNPEGKMAVETIDFTKIAPPQPAPAQPIN